MTSLKAESRAVDQLNSLLCGRSGNVFVVRSNKAQPGRGMFEVDGVVAASRAKIGSVKSRSK